MRGTWYENEIFLSALKITAWPGFHPCNSNIKTLDVYSLLCRFFYFAPPKVMRKQLENVCLLSFLLKKKQHNKLTSKKKALLVLWNNRCCLWPWDLRANLFLFTCLEFLGFASMKAAVGNEGFERSEWLGGKNLSAQLLLKKWLFSPPPPSSLLTYRVLKLLLLFRAFTTFNWNYLLQMA